MSTKKSSYVIAVPDELLADVRPRELTPAERADIQQREAARLAKLDTARQQLAALAALTNPLARAILDLHHEDQRGECDGDDFDGLDGERPSWPCRTVETVAEHYGIELP